MQLETTIRASAYCTFHVGPFLYGIEVRHVQEVIRSQPTTPVPLAPGFVRGLVNLRGRIVSAFDLAAMLGLQPKLNDADKQRREMNVVIRTADEPISLIVDEIGDVVVADEKSYESAPASFQGRQREFIHGVHKLEQGLLLVLDANAVTRLAA